MKIFNHDLFFTFSPTINLETLGVCVDTLGALSAPDESLKVSKSQSLQLSIMKKIDGKIKTTVCFVPNH